MDIIPVDTFPPSVQKVYEHLQTDKLMTIQDIRLITNLSRRTVSVALSQLIKANLVNYRADLSDMRKRRFFALRKAA
ncbi:MAG: hypothetical protein EAX86_06260 [Candidatus Heimdallarchaeota archaeon]|nr:hypothetical protein [Candidatus Heimdallarchaeota archaeon]